MPDAGHLASIYGHLHDVGYVAVGYSLTLVALIGYRWHLAVRTRRARRYVTTVTGRDHGGRRRA
jgi:hypothetical protein